jgi:hypothetical protein
MKVPRQCQIVLLVKVMHITGINFYDVGKAITSNMGELY